MNRSVVAFLLASVVAGAAHAAALAKVTVERIPDTLSSYNQAAWWSPIAVDPKDGSVYMSYLRPVAGSTSDDVYVARRDGVTGAWAVVDTGGNAYHDSGHTQASLAIDGSGYVHVAYGMHNNPMTMSVTSTAHAISGGFKKETSPAFTSTQYTYPNMTTAPNGNVYMIARDRTNSTEGRLFEYNNAAKTWSQLSAFAGQLGTTVYPDQVYARADGKLAVIWEWAAGTPQATRHYGTYALYDPATGIWSRANGTAYTSLPITIATGDIYQGLEGSETFVYGSHGVQSAKMTVDPNNNPIITYAYSVDNTASGYEHRLARWDGGKWIVSTVTPGPFDSDKSWITYSDGTLRFYGTLSPSDPARTGDDIFLKISTDFGATWSDPQRITSGLSVQRPVGVTQDGVDYLYLPDVTSGNLYMAVVSTPEPATIGLLGFAVILLRRK